MPLIKSKSKKAIGKNIDTEMEAGKPKAQSLAIALNVQRHAKKKAKKMAQGGEVTATTEKKADIDNASDSRDMRMTDDHSLKHGAEVDMADGMKGIDSQDRMRDEDMLDGHSTRHEQDIMATSEKRANADDSAINMAQGGQVTANDEHRADIDEHYDSIADAILAKKKKVKMMAEGGEVDIQENGEEEGSNPFDNMNEDAAKKELYDDSQLSAQPEDSNEHGDSIDEDEHDMISKIRRSMKNRGKNMLK